MSTYVISYNVVSYSTGEILSIGKVVGTAESVTDFIIATDKSTREQRKDEDVFIVPTLIYKED